MALRQAVRNVSVILFVIVIKCQTSSSRADDDDDGNSSKEYSEPLTRSSSASRALFSTVATMKPPMRRAPRGLDSNRNDVYISERVCGDDGVFYDNISELNKAGAKLLLEIFCESGCLIPQENPCSSSVPVCTGPEIRRVYENECELRRINCERLENDLPPIQQVDPSLCGLESCGQPIPSPCPTKVPVCAGHGENYTIYEDMCHVDQTRCNRKGNGLRPIISEKIGRCQVEVNESQLTCHDILRGKCPRGTFGKQVCDITITTTNKVVTKTFRNICRALHKRCKKMDDTCYSIEGNCRSHEGKYNVTNYPPRQDCSRYIRHSFPMVDVGRACYHMPAAAAAAAASKRYCRCDSGAPYSAPTMPEYPAAMVPSSLLSDITQTLQ